MSATKHNSAPIATQLGDHNARLISLQVCLQDALRYGAITQKQYQERATFLVQQLMLQKQLSSWAAAEEVSLTQELNLGLPDLERCSSDERKLCYQFLSERLETLEGIAKEASTILDAVEESTYGSTNFIKQTLALSKLKKCIEKLDAERAGIELDNRDTEQIMYQLSSLFNNGRVHATLKESLEALMRLFQELDVCSARVAQLKAMMRNEEEQIAHMRMWLHTERHSLSDPMGFTPPPSIEDTAKLGWNAFATQKDYLSKTQRKLDLAEKYIETCSSQTRIVHAKKVGAT